MKVLGIIPARYASSRFPGKPLVMIKGKSMIQRVYLQASKSNKLDHLLVATDDERIFKHVQGFGGNAIMTSSEHQSGTDRCLEAMEKQKGVFDVVINIQGDEPFIDPKQVDDLVACFEDKETDIATLVKKVHQVKELESPSMVKVVINNKDQAMYFSRSIIPYIHEVPIEQWTEQYDFYEHVGIYGYTQKALKSITQMPVSSYEVFEKLEQLRWLENGLTIKVAYTNIESEPIDTPEDLKRILGRLNTVELK
jgi:3-deoxy-manno-octulosonate cytidylyltransferase (CMP-KDO synthetase)